MGIRATYWFPSMRKRIQSHIENCITCLMANASTHAKEGDMQIEKAPDLPFEVVHIDHFGPLPTTRDGYKYILVVIDAFSRYTWFIPTRSTGTQEVCEQLQNLFNTFGIPKELVSDRGTAFTSNDFTRWVDAQKIKHRKVAVAAPWANGLAERANRFLKTSLAKLVKDPNEWKSYASTVQYVVNNTMHKAIKATPSKLLLGYEQRQHTDMPLTTLINQLGKIEIDLEKERQLARDIAIQATEKIRNYNKIYYDKRHKSPTTYNIGDFVVIRDLQLKPGQHKKFKANYKGPYVITKVLNNHRYVVQDVPGFNHTAKPYNSILSPDKLKPWKNDITNYKTDVN